MSKEDYSQSMLGNSISLGQSLINLELRCNSSAPSKTITTGLLLLGALQEGTTWVWHAAVSTGNTVGDMHAMVWLEN